MYRIINAENGESIGAVDRPRYIRRAANGCFVECGKGQAIGIAYRSEPYNLEGHEDIQGAGTVLVREADGAGALLEQEAAQRATDSFVYADQYMKWDGLKWVFDPENPIPLLRLPFANGVPNAFYRYADGKRYVYVAAQGGEITEDNWDDVMVLWD